ncbi:MAG: transketolase [Flavobacteriales bacterium]|nr:transketolase [Flavobacteriales bacterium]
MSKPTLKDICTQTRRDILRMITAVNSGHPGGALGCTEFMVALYHKIMEHNPNSWDPDGRDQDVFFLSNGHLSSVWYSVLARCGYFPVSELSTFRHINSRLQGHPTCHQGLEGIRMASGSLGQGLSVAIGTALAKKLNGDKHLVYTLHGDGEIQEGQIWEAVMYAGAKGVDNIIATIDANGCQIDGTTDQVLALGNLENKFKAFGWDVVPVGDGNDIEQVTFALGKAKALSGKGKPVVVLMKTMMGHGVDFMMHTHKWHGKAPSQEQLEIALAQNPETILGDY